MKVYLIKRFDENYVLGCNEEDVKCEDYIVGVCLTKEKAVKVAESYVTCFANKIAGIIPYENEDEEWSLQEWHDIWIDIDDLEVDFKDKDDLNYTVSFLIEEMEVIE